MKVRFVLWGRPGFAGNPPIDVETVNEALGSVFDGKHAPQLIQIVSKSDYATVVVTSETVSLEQAQAIYDSHADLPDARSPYNKMLALKI